MDGTRPIGPQGTGKSRRLSRLDQPGTVGEVIAAAPAHMQRMVLPHGGTTISGEAQSLHQHGGMTQVLGGTKRMHQPLSIRRAQRLHQPLNIR